MANGPGILSAIGRGLSLGGGVLNPQIFEQQQQERAQEKVRAQQLDEQRKNAMFQLIFSAAQEGAIPGDEATKALQMINPEMFANLPEGVLGPSAATQRALQQRQALEQFAGSLTDPRAQAAVLAGQGGAAAKFELGTGGAGAASAIGKLAEDFRAGRITKEEYEAARRKATYIAPRAQSEGDQRDRKIQSIMAQGLDRNQAANIVDGNVDIKINENTGRIVLTDLVTRQVTELPVGSATDQRVVVPPSESLYSTVGEGATGVVPGALEAASRVTGQLGLPVAKKTIEVRQGLRTAQGEMIRALAINPKLPVAEINRIREEIDIDPSLFDSTDALKARMRSMDNSLRRRLAQAERDANDPNLPEDLRSSQAQNAAAMRNFLDQLGAPQESQGDDDALIRKYLDQ